MKRIDLERHLRREGCVLVRHGGRHDVWTNPVLLRESTLPRHREVLESTVRSICRSLGVRLPR